MPEIYQSSKKAKVKRNKAYFLGVFLIYAGFY